MGGGDGVAGLQAKYLVRCCCNCDSLKFDMQHDHILKKGNFDLLTQTGWWGDGLRAKYFIPCGCISDSL